MNSDAHRPEQTARGGIVHHRLFPAIAMLWVASLLIFAAMAVPASLLERAAAAARLDQLIPAARPPLGFTARLLLAFVLVLGGGSAGWLGALALRRRAARSAPPASRMAKPAPAAEPAPESVAPGDDEEDLARLAAARQGAGQRRRALTSETADAPPILEISAIPALEPLTAPHAAESRPDPESPAAPQAASPAADSPIRFRTLRELGGTAAARLCLAPLESLTVVQLVERFALALHARRQRGEPQPDRAAEHPAQPTQRTEPAQRTDPAPFAEPRAAHEGPAPVAAGRPFDMPETAPATADPTGAVAPWTRSKPGNEGEEIDEELIPDPAARAHYSSLAEIRPATRVPPPLPDCVRVEDHDDAPLAEIGPQPVVVFPGQTVPAPPASTRLPGRDGPAGTQDTEAALREALAALQRMSGAA